MIELKVFFCRNVQEVLVKRIIPLFLAVLLLMGCTSIADRTGSAMHAATPAPSIEEVESSEPTAVSSALGPFLSYSFYGQPDWRKLTSDTLFDADLDQNGIAEPISFTLRPNNKSGVAITWGKNTVVLNESSEFVRADVLDLNTESPFYNLLVVLDCGSDSYVTIELHPENGQLVKGNSISGRWEWDENTLWSYERTDFLGTAVGKRSYSGDGLTPDSEWLDMHYIPTAEELETEWDYLVEDGILLHTTQPVPCTIDGEPGFITADVYVYRTRFQAGDELAEVCLPDGTLALIACTVGEDGWPYLIDGQDQLYYFDNPVFAD